MQQLPRPPALRRAPRLDNSTVQRILDGSLSCGDAPPEYRVVARSLSRLRTTPANAELIDEATVVGSMVASLASEAAPRSSQRWIMASKRRLASVAAASLVGGVSLFSGLAAANAL